MTLRKTILLVVGLIMIGALALFTLLIGEDRQELRLLHATNEQHIYDTAVYGSFSQSLIANVVTETAALGQVRERSLNRYDIIYLDRTLHGTDVLRSYIEPLRQYVDHGGHLFVEQALFDDLPADLLGGSRIADFPSVDKLSFTYPSVEPNLQRLQDTYRRFADHFNKHIGLAGLPGFQWGRYIVPDTAQTIVGMNDIPLLTVNPLGKGSVVAVGAFLPNRYFITGFDLMSGMDPEQGFAKLVEAHQAKPRLPGADYFDRSRIELEPYFHFAFATANHLLRTEYIAYVSKEKLGYAVRKTLGPYGRPAMAYQNHFEALAAFRDREGIQWAELLKQRNQIPSFSLVRSAFEWWTWTETVTVHLNEGTKQAPQFAGELTHSYYGSGTHLIVDGKPLTLAVYPDRLTLSDRLAMPYRAAPAMADLNGDGRADLLVGSADGNLYAYMNQGSSPEAYKEYPMPSGLTAPDHFGPRQQLVLPTGHPLQVGSYSAVAVFDSNGDGKPDIVAGNGDGTVRLFIGEGELRFSGPKDLIGGGQPIRVVSHAVPAFGDLDGDGRADLVVGDGEGRVFGYRGLPSGGFMKGEELVRLPATYAAPSVRDVNGDGKADLIIGSNEGDLRLYTRSGSGWADQGPLVGGTMNQLGNQALVGGHNSVPFWYDINHDGLDDLIVGQVEYGPAVPLDSPRFPYPKQLTEFIQYSQENHLELYPHLYFHNYVSSEQEQQEIELHRESFQKLGIPWQHTGTNQHTWRINNTDRLQTLLNERNAGLWFNFGFKPSHAPTDPQWGPDYIWGIPFLLNSPDKDSNDPMLIHTPSPTLRIGGDYSTEDLYESFVALDLPIDYFEHIEYHFPDRVQELMQFVDYFDRIRTEHDYNFMTEPQMARSFLSALTGKVIITRSWAAMTVDKVKDWLGRGQHLTLNVRTDTANVPAQAAEYRDTLGIVIEPGEKYLTDRFTTDSDVFLRRENNLYIGLHRPVKVDISWAAEPMHLLRANVPVIITKHGETWAIDTGSPGMQQLKLYSPQPVTIEGPNLRVEHDDVAGTYTITHFGDAVTITVSPRR
jgi:hypothetical protein